MLIATNFPLPMRPDSPSAFCYCTSLETLISGFAAQHYDAVVLLADRSPPEAIAPLTAACLSRPVSTVWVRDDKSKTLTAVAAGEHAIAPGSRVPFENQAGSQGMRTTWLQGWARWVGTGAQRLKSPAPLRDLPSMCFLRAMSVRSVPELCSAMGRNYHGLRRQLAELGLAGPKRFLMAARVFQVWEYLRLGTMTLEKIALQVGFATLSSMGHCFKFSLQLPPRAVGALSEAELAGALARLLATTGRSNKESIAA